MKKVLFLINSLGGGGAERVLVNLVNNIDKDKYDVTVQTIFDNGVNIQDLSSEVHYIPGFKKMIRGNVIIFRAFSPKVLYKKIIKEEYDIVIGFLEGVASRIISGCSNSNTKKVAWIHVEHDTTDQLAYPFGSRKKAERAYNSMDKIICVADTVKDNFTSLLSITAPVETLYNVNETRKIRNQALEKIESNFYDDSLNIVSVGRLIDVKGYDRLINIHKRLIDCGIKNKVFVFGTGEREERLKQQAKALGVTDTFVFMGFSRNPYKYVSKADLFVCSSRREGFSTAVTEALLCGVPVVSTNVSGAYELLGNNNDYGIVTENDEISLYNGIIEMLNGDNLSKYKQLSAKRGNAFDKRVTIEAIENMLSTL